MKKLKRITYIVISLSLALAVLTGCGNNDTTINMATKPTTEQYIMGSKMLVMDGGKIQQYDTPGNIKKRPANDFVKKLLAGTMR